MKLLTMWLVAGSVFSSAVAVGQNRSAYTTELEAWHETRVKELKADNGWLNLVGLYWLKSGSNTFGSGEGVDIRFPKGSIAEKAGHFSLDRHTVTMHAAKDAAITIKGNRIISAVIFNIDSATNPVVSAGTLRWTVIKREDKFGIRLRDLSSKAVSGFKGIERFPIDSTWRVEAVFEKAPQQAQLFITNVLGQTTGQPTPGKVVFNINGTKYSLETMEGGKDDLFIVFGDATTGKETYEAGRFIYVKKPGADGKTVIDFNKAYNPPCVFTEFATCPLPPSQNVLPIAITAGEKNYKSH